MIFKTGILDEACVHAQCMENIGHKKGKPIGFKQKEHYEASKEGKKKWKGGNDKNMTSNTHQFKDPSNHFNIYGHTKEKCWKLHIPQLNLKNCKKEEKKKNF
jgi:hypothetical protein